MPTSPVPNAPFTPEQTAWINGFMAGLASCGRVILPGETGAPAPAKDSHAVGGFSKDKPFPAPLRVNRSLNGEGSAKDTRHFEFDLAGSGLTYEVGDALGVCPTNWPEYVEEVIKALGFKGDETVALTGGGSATVRDAFTAHFDITKPSRNFIEAVAQRSDSPNLKRLLDPQVSGDLSKYLWGREVIDLLLEFPAAKFTPAEFLSFMKKLAPRLYSIASSIKAHPNSVHLTVAIVRYEAVGRKRKGVCSTYMAERVEKDKPAPVFMHSNKNFRLTYY
jgi:sulfite reductase (NADPH) flavoprotein alpha-component